MSDARDAGDLQFSAVAEAIPQMAWTALPTGEVDYVNRQMYAYAGSAAGTGGRWAWDALVHPEDVAAVREAWEACVVSGEPCQVEARLRRADGAYRWFLLRASPVRDANGAVTRWFGTCTDIDELRGAAARDAFLARADELFAAELEPEPILLAVARAAVAAFADYVLFDLVGDDGVLRRAAVEHRDPKRRSPFQRSVGEVPPLDHPVHPIAAAWRSGESVLVPRIDATWWRRAAADDAHYARMRDEGLMSVITVIIASRGRRYGVLTFCRTRASQSYDDADLATAEDLARRIGAALENARLYQEARTAAETQRRIAEREAFYARLGEAIAETLDLRETLDAITTQLVPEFADWALVNLIDDDGNLYLAASHHREPGRDARMRAFLDARYLAGDASAGSPAVARTKKPVVYEHLPDGGLGPVTAPYRDAITSLGLLSATIVPIVLGGTVRGTLATMFDSTSSAAMTPAICRCTWRSRAASLPRSATPRRTSASAASRARFKPPR